MEPPFIVKFLDGRGRGLVASRLIRAGEVVLQEAPLLLAVARDLEDVVCSHCLRMTSEKRYERLMSLGGNASEATLREAAPLHAALVQLLGPEMTATVSQEEVATLLAKEQMNAYGIMAPSGPDGERRIRGGAIYWQASLINHECIPNVTRFDFFDSGKPDSTHVQFRALHDLPEGTELVQSYFPLNWDYATRQQQCQSVYGFVCRCPRCLLEERWEMEGSSGSWETDGEEETEGADGDEEVGDAEGTSGRPQELDTEMACSPPSTCLHPCTEAMGDSRCTPAAPPSASAAPAAAEALEPTYLQLFLLKYVCSQPSCFGTMAPALGSDVYECAVCGHTRTEKQFLAELETAHGP